MVLISELVKRIEQRWPLSSAEAWDNPGIAFAPEAAEVRRVLLSVDVTGDVIREALGAGAQLVLSHHPVLFRPINSLAGNAAPQVLIRQAIASNISLYSAHTNVDHVSGGVSDEFAKALGIRDASALDEVSGHGRIGNLREEMPLRDFASRLAATLPVTSQGILVQGDPLMRIRKVALLAGSGDSFLELAVSSGADVFVTSDLKHHRALDYRIAGRENPRALVAVSHWAAESLWLNSFASQLTDLEPQVEFVVSKINTDPWDFKV